MDINKVEESIGYKFKNKDLLINALTHTSYAHENNKESNEKLEFLGDSILEFVSSKYIYNKYPNLQEGEMTKVRATVVCEESLYKIAKSHGFGEFLFLGRSEVKTGGKNRPAILADSVEAVIAAIYLDGGLQEADKFIIENLDKEIEKATKHGEVKIEYEIINETGPDHDKYFEAQVKCNGKILAQGKGKSKKEAHMHAAKKALENL